MKLVRKFLPTATGKVGILNITVPADSSQGDWEKEVMALFHGVELLSCRKAEETFEPALREVTMAELEASKKQQKLSQLRHYMMAVGKGKLLFKNNLGQI